MSVMWCITNILPIFVCICWICRNGAAEASPTVQIQNGTLEGMIMKSRRGREFAAFRGIPYAQPPLDELRFEPPMSFGSWNGVRFAKDDANMCIQRDMFSLQAEVIGSEDCLYLNVYSPKLSSLGTDPIETNFPVMVWLHGGGWISGAGHSAFYGPKFLLDHEIVLVTVNYRLGPLGFLSTGDLVSPGNQGMKDQAQSIRWVRENIAAFGGDPNRVTLFGESAGGASVHYHMISPLSRGISQSGTVQCPWAMIRPGIARKNANRLGKLMNCPIDESRALVECLKRKDPVDIIATDPPFSMFDARPVLPFRPVIEPDHPGAFIKEEPVQSLKNGNVADIPWMTGITSHEGAIRVAGIFGQEDKGYVKLLNDKFIELGPLQFSYEHTSPDNSNDNVIKKIREFYLGVGNIDDSARMNLVDLYTDAWFYIPIDNTVRDHAEALSSPIYYYYFNYKGSSSFTAVFGDPKNDYGVSHCDELQYLFPVGELLFPDTPLSKQDHKMVDLMTRLWVNFATSGNPTSEKTPEIPVKWKPVRTSRLEYLHIQGSKNLSMKAQLLFDRVNFWANIPYLGKIERNHDDYNTKDEL